MGFVAAANPADRSLAIVPAALLDGGPAPTSFELWVIPPGGTPHSLGLVDPSKAVRVVVPPELWPHVSADSVLAITVEPPGGSPTGKPTGPVIANGPLATLSGVESSCPDYPRPCRHRVAMKRLWNGFRSARQCGCQSRTSSPIGALLHPPLPSSVTAPARDNTQHSGG